MNHIEQLRKIEADGKVFTTAILGAGYVAGGVVDIIEIIPAFTVSLIVNRTVQRAIDLLEISGVDKENIVVSDDKDVLMKAMSAGRHAVTSSYQLLPQLDIDIAIEATGAIDYGTNAILKCLDSRIDVVSYLSLIHI